MPHEHTERKADRSAEGSRVPAGTGWQGGADLRLQDTHSLTDQEADDRKPHHPDNSAGECRGLSDPQGVDSSAGDRHFNVRQL
jgi:hypothetical protein